MNTIAKLRGSGGCFVAGTLVRTPTGPRPIESLKVGDLVICFDEDLNFYSRPVTQIFLHEDEDVYSYRFWNSNIIKGTPVHAFLNQHNVFKEIGLFDTQDFARDHKKNLVPFISETFLGKLTVYNLHVAEFHTYIANDLLVHNGGGGKDSGGSSFYEAPNTAQSAATAQLLEVISCGEIEGLVDGAKSIYLDETALVSSNGTTNFSGVTWQSTSGTADQPVIPGFEDIDQEYSVAVMVTTQSPVTRRIDSRYVDAIVVKLQVPSGLSYMDTAANQLLGTSVSLKIEISYDGGVWEHLGDAVFNEKTRSTYERDYYFTLKTSEFIEVRVTRLTPDSTDSSLVNDTAWAGYTLLSGYKLNYPNCALMSYIVDSREFGSSLPLRYTHIKGIKVDVPSNYDPDTRSYSGIWDGTFKRAYTNNPAWFVWWLLTDKINGIGNDIPVSALDQTKMDLYEIAQYNDELVPDGYGGFEPRFTFNAWIIDRQNTFEFLQLVCGTFNALVFWNGNNIKISQDSPKDVERVFGNANVIGGKFTYNEIPQSSKHSIAVVTYNDMTDFGKAATVTVEDTEQIHKLGNKVLDITVLGCNSRGQATRSGAFHIYTEKFEAETVSFKVGLADCTAQPGDIIGLSDDDRTGANYQGRVKKIENSTITLDRVISFKSEHTYQLTLTLSDGGVQTIDLLNPGIDTDTVQFIDTLRTNAVNGAVWVMMSTELVPTEWRILSIVEDEPTQFSISALQYDRRKYDYIEYGYEFPAPPTSLIPSGPLPPPTNLGVREYLYRQSSDIILSAGVFSWTHEMDPRIMYTEVRIKKSTDTVYMNMGSTTSLSIDIKDLLAGDYIFEARSISAIGLKSSWAVVSYKIQGLEMPLPNVLGFTTVFIEDRYYLIWDRITDPRSFYYEVRKGVDWNTSQTIAQTQDNKYPLMGAGIYHIKARYQTAESVLPATLEVENITGSGLVHNVIAVLDEQSTHWNGTETGFQYLEEMNAIRMDISPGFYGIADFYAVDDFYLMGYTGEESVYTLAEDKAVLITGNHACNISVDYDAFAQLKNENFYGVADFYAVKDFYGSSTVQGWQVWLEVMVRDNGVWGEWITFHPNKYVGDGFKFRLKATANSEAVVYITKLTISVDVPDKTFLFTRLEVTPEGTRIDFNPPFNVIPNIQGTLIGANPGDSFSEDDTDVYLDHAIVRVLDINGDFINKLVNITAQGY